MKWQPIETAPKDDDSIILGFARDDELFAPRSREGFFNKYLGVWVSSLNPDWADGPQPTHWMPLPDPPEGE